MAKFETRTIDEQIISLPTVGTASGSIATFNTDLAENLVEVKCQIVAKQEDSPHSPDMGIPITTYTEMNLLACGANLIDDTKYDQYDTNSVTIGQTEGRTERKIYLPKGTYTMTVVSSKAATVYYSVGGSSISIGKTDLSRTFILFDDSWCVFWIYLNTGYSVSDFVSAKLEKGSNPTSYTPYNGTTKNIQFGQTVANGVLDVTTGKLRVTHGIVELDENWYWFKGDTQPTGKTVITTTNFPSHISDDEFSSNFVKASTEYIVQMAYGDFMLSPTGTTGYFCYKNTDDGTAEDFKRFIAIQRDSDTPIQVYYKLAEPIEIQLDSTALQALLNENNIWCDTGDTEVKYLLTVGRAS